MDQQQHRLCKIEEGVRTLLAFICPGCGCGHHVQINPNYSPCWEWNGSLTQPTIQPSILCSASNPAARCHSFVRDGKISFLPDCHHRYAGKEIALPLWDQPDSF